MNLFAVVNEVTMKEGDEAFVQLACEMRDYVRPDEDLLWFKGDYQLYDGIGSRYYITFEDGLPDTAQNGSNSTVASRRSILYIQYPIVEDSGEYVCIVRGTNQSAAISLTVTKLEGVLIVYLVSNMHS